MTMRRSLVGICKVSGLMLILASLCNTAMAGAGPPPTPTPEIDPGSILGALALLSGGVMVLTDRCRAK